MHLYQKIVEKKKKRHKIHTYLFNPLINVLKCEQISAIPLRPRTITSIFFVYVFLWTRFTTSCNLTGLFFHFHLSFFKIHPSPNQVNTNDLPVKMCRSGTLDCQQTVGTPSLFWAIFSKNIKILKYMQKWYTFHPAQHDIFYRTCQSVDSPACLTGKSSWSDMVTRSRVDTKFTWVWPCESKLKTTM